MSPPATIAALLSLGVMRLTVAGVPDPARDARRLLAAALQMPVDRLSLSPDLLVSAAASATYEVSLEARIARQPVAQIIGQRLFWGRNFRVTRDTLDPRPETECLIEAALTKPFERVLDLGTGTGCILLSCLAERTTASGIGIDISAAALGVAQVNAERLGLTERATFRLGNWCHGLTGQFDLIVSNPPYVSAEEMLLLDADVHLWEPHQALSPGGDGLDAYRHIARDLLFHLTPKGRVLVEIGPSQARAVTALFADQGLLDIQILPDLDGRDRIIAARAP